jgi:toxin ParE1/3/4
MKLRITPQARRHIESIAEFLQGRSPAVARRVRERLRKTFELLMAVPLIGHQGTLEGTREFVVTGFPYVVVYRVNLADNALEIVGVYHGAQLRPGQEKRKK